MSNLGLKIVRLACVSGLVSMAVVMLMLMVDNIKPSWEMDTIAVVEVVGLGVTTTVLRWREMKYEANHAEDHDESNLSA